MVSCTSGENMPELRLAIYRAALDLKETENAGKGDPLIGRKVRIVECMELLIFLIQPGDFAFMF